MKKWMIRGWILPLGMYVGALVIEFLMDMAYLYCHPQTQTNMVQTAGSVTIGFQPEPWFFLLSCGWLTAVGIASLCQRIAVLRNKERYEMERAAVMIFGVIFDLLLIGSMCIMMLAYAARL